MPEVLLIALSITCLLFGIILGVSYLLSLQDSIRIVHGSVPALLLIGGILGGLWLAGSYQNDLPIAKEHIVDVITIDTVQVAVTNYDDEVNIWNMTQKFKRVFPPNTQVKVIYYKSAFVFGIWRFQEPTIEVLEQNPC